MPSPNPDTFLRLYLEHERRIHAFIVSVLGNLADADDVLQETGLLLWQKFDQFEPGTDFLAWACRIAQFRSLKSLEKRRQSRLTFRPEVLEAVYEEVRLTGPLLETRHQALVRCLDRLPSGDRDLLRLRYTEGFSPKEISTQVGRSVHAIYKSLNRIREALLSCIERRLTGELRTENGGH
ncbi:MAG TPA: sigma-70 family RNA polymerase sigma factor [Planctomicrobium sp.]|nr:sigma-70 family RNA polymerase sigma factor [Planctomicrobium sp.]